MDESDNTSLLGAAMVSGAQKVGASVVDRALGAIVDFVKDKYGKAKIELGTVFQRYLKNATERYNKVKTLATGQTSREIIGPDSIYVNIGLSYENQEIDTSTVEPMLNISKNILIVGTGGIGKSMLMRYLFLVTAELGEHVPVLVELRRINKQPSDQLSILELIYTCMEDFNVKLPREQFEYSLVSGKYLFLFDGLDEVNTSLSAETAEALQKFSAKYPKNPCIITSRPYEGFSPLETYTTMEPMTLRKEQAVRLAEKIRPEDEKAQEFCRQLEEFLYDTHKSFAENPLLLSMMFLTFMRNSSIPDHLSDFYQKAFDALYSIHDSTDKGSYRRDFRCKALNEESFKRLFAHFCFHSYMDEAYEFTKDDILKRLQNSINKLNLEIIDKDYLTDLRNSVCMIIKDGDMFRFSHRSFQTYFAAYYTAHVLTDEQQKKLFSSLLSMPQAYWKRDYYTLLVQIEPERFAINALADDLRKLVEAATRSNNRNEFILKSLCPGVYLSKDRIGIIPQPHSFIVEIFFIDIIHSMSRNFAIKNDSIDVIRGYAEATVHSSISHILNFSKIDTSDCTEAERERLYSAIISCLGLDNAYQEISDWLSEIDAKSESLKRYNFIDEL